MSKATNNISKLNEINKKMIKYNDRFMIDIGYDFIENACNNNENILIHCMAGVSRSASVLIYYFMKKKLMNYYESYSYIHNIRHIINPNDSFKSQLEKYDTMREKFNDEIAGKIIKKNLRFNIKYKLSINIVDCPQYTTYSCK